MDEKRKVSLKRAEELKQAISGFMEFKKTYPLATDKIMEERQEKQKKQQKERGR